MLEMYMKKISVKLLSVILASAVCLPISVFSAGDGAYKDSDAAPFAVQTAKLAAPSIAQAAEFKLSENLQEPVTEAITKFEAIVDVNPATGVLPQAKTAGDFDNDPVNLLDFGGDFLAGYLRGLNNLTSRLADTGGEFPEFVFDYDDNAGKSHSIYMGMYYDEANQLIIGRDQQGAFALGFDFDLQKRMMFSSYNGWERNMGFCRLYDRIAPAAGVFYKTHRINFEYAGQDWMVQIWKGIYFLVGSGAEIGIYNKPQSRTLAYYDCIEDDDMLEMSIRLRKGEQLLLERAPQKHWWMNGVVLSDGLYPPKALTLEGSIRFEDEGMKAAFLVPFEQLCAQEGITYNIDGGLVSFVW